MKRHNGLVTTENEATEHTSIPNVKGKKRKADSMDLDEATEHTSIPDELTKGKKREADSMDLDEASKSSATPPVAITSFTNQGWLNVIISTHGDSYKFLNRLMTQETQAICTSYHRNSSNTRTDQGNLRQTNRTEHVVE
jgi:hypothetical protein